VWMENVECSMLNGVAADSCSRSVFHSTFNTEHSTFNIQLFSDKLGAANRQITHCE
jgi:hypothetical protein